MAIKRKKRRSRAQLLSDFEALVKPEGAGEAAGQAPVSGSPLDRHIWKLKNGTFAELKAMERLLPPDASVLLPRYEEIPREMRGIVAAFYDLRIRMCLQRGKSAAPIRTVLYNLDIEDVFTSPALARIEDESTEIVEGNHDSRNEWTSRRLLDEFLERLEEASIRSRRSLKKLLADPVSEAAFPLANKSCIERDMMALVVASTEELNPFVKTRGLNPSGDGRSTITEIRNLLRGLHHRDELNALLSPQGSLFVSGTLDIEFSDLAEGTWDSAEVLYAGSSGRRRTYSRRSEKVMADTLTPEVTLDEVIMPEEDRNNLRALCREYRNALERGDPSARLTLLLSGPPGTGKTMTALAVARELGCQVFRLVLSGSGAQALCNLLNYLSARAQRGHSIVLFDEADAILTSNPYIGSSDSWAKVAFDTFKGVAIFTTNDTEISAPIRRRMNYIMEFANPGVDARLAVLKREVEQLAAERSLKLEVKDGELDRIAREYAIAGGFFAQAMMLAVANSPRGTLSGGALEKAVAHHFEGNDRGSGDEPRHPRILLEDVKLDPPNRAELDRFLQHARATLQQRGNRPPHDALGATILLSGPPGTGKTMTAEAIASALGIPFQRLSPSSLLNPYVGGTEANIRRAFLQASRHPRVLMIDEAEGLFASRQGAVRNWEVTLANELLQQVESFRGVLVIASNHTDLMDPAFARRFIFHIKLDVPGPDTRLSLWRQWQDRLGLPESLVHRVAESVELTGGEIRNVALRALARGGASGAGVEEGELLALCRQVSSDRTGRTLRKVGI